jgi:hypothetical protein
MGQEAEFYKQMRHCRHEIIQRIAIKFLTLVAGCNVVSELNSRPYWSLIILTLLYSFIWHLS